MRQITTNYAKLSAGKAGEEVHPTKVRHLPVKDFYPHSILLAFTFVLFVPFAFAQKGTITGRVTGSEGVLQAATVTAGKTSVVTDNRGRFSMSLNPGNHTLVITHVGYKKLIQDLNITNGNTQTVDVSLVTAENLDEVTVLGSRSLVQRSNLNTAVPVDVFTAKQLEQTAQASYPNAKLFCAIF